MTTQQSANNAAPSPARNVASVAVAMVTYGDRAKLLAQALEGLFTQTARDHIKHVVVCDNGAGKESKALLADTDLREPKLHIVTLPENAGSARGFGEAIRVAAACGCDYVWFLDDDNRPYLDALERLLDSLDLVEPRAALLSLRDSLPQYVRRAQGASVVEAFERRYSFLGFSVLDLPKKACQRLLDYGDEVEQGMLVRTPVWIPIAPYGGFLCRTEQLSQVGLPNADFYLYEDDHEFTSRFVRLGYPIYLVPDSRIEDLEHSWHLRRSNRSLWGSRRLLMNREEHMVVRQFFEVRNRTFFESHSRGWGRNPFYLLNALGFLLLLFVQALLLRSQGHRLPWLSFLTILSAAWHGWRGRLGQELGRLPSEDRREEI